MSGITCPNCNVVVPPKEVADGWCENCGKKLPLFVLGRSADAAFGSPTGPRPETEQGRFYSGRCDFCNASRVEKRYLVVSGISWLFFVIPPIVTLFSPKLRQLTTPVFTLPCSSCAGCSRRFSRLQWQRILGLVLMLSVFPIGCWLYLPLGAQRVLNEQQRYLASSILVGTFLIFCAMPFLIAFYVNRRLRNVMGAAEFSRMMTTLGLRRLGMRHVGLKNDAPAWGKVIRW